jgi:hypothetical protein
MAPYPRRVTSSSPPILKTIDPVTGILAMLL